MPLIWPQRTKNPGDTTVRLLDDMVQQQDSQGQWMTICTIQGLNNLIRCLQADRRWKKIVRQHQEAEANGTDEGKRWIFCGFFEEGGEWTCGCDPANYGGPKKVLSADKVANGNANNKKNKGNNNGRAVENTQTGQGNRTGRNTDSCRRRGGGINPAPATPSPIPTPSNQPSRTDSPAEPTPSDLVQLPDAGSGDLGSEDIGWTDGVL